MTEKANTNHGEFSAQLAVGSPMPTRALVVGAANVVLSPLMKRLTYSALG